MIKIFCHETDINEKSWKDCFPTLTAFIANMEEKGYFKSEGNQLTILNTNYPDKKKRKAEKEEIEEEEEEEEEEEGSSLRRTPRSVKRIKYTLDSDSEDVEIDDSPVISRRGRPKKVVPTKKAPIQSSPESSPKKKTKEDTKHEILRPRRISSQKFEELKKKQVIEPKKETLIKKKGGFMSVTKREIALAIKESAKKESALFERELTLAKKESKKELKKEVISPKKKDQIELKKPKEKPPISLKKISSGQFPIHPSPVSRSTRSLGLYEELMSFQDFHDPVQMPVDLFKSSHQKTETKLVIDLSSDPSHSRCPICNKNLGKSSDRDINMHIDECLTLQTLKEEPRAQAPSMLAPSPVSNPTQGVLFVERMVNTDDEYDGECGICYDPFEAGRSVVRLECMCLFHSSCFLPWFQKTKHCPLHVSK
eukprot:TRINITY_DN2997_c0_g1_i4.p1 TRINITY_DN2997_c0_g1~~TRINITY_DN2997_c0_g1_i4.p1  ORF type:complete len:424 (-),score=84.19 TRINITY_DN2997_c0_g1_i4:21-1292(-)